MRERFISWTKIGPLALLLLVAAFSFPLTLAQPAPQLLSNSGKLSRLVGLKNEGQSGDLSKLSTSLVTLLDEYEAYLENPAVGEFQSVDSSLPLIGSTIKIDAVASESGNALLADLQALGLSNGVAYKRLVSGRLPLASLRRAASLASLKLVRPAQAIRNVGATTSQGDQAQRSDVARGFGLDGTGVTVGVLSDTYDDHSGTPATNAADDVASGDLPAGVLILDDTGGPGIDEGRAMLQIVHDVAPGAALSFHTAFNGLASFALGIEELAGCPPGSTGGCMAAADPAEVIVDDVFYFSEPFFQDGVIAQAVNVVDAAGVAYFSSAGNSARQSYEATYNASGLATLFPGGNSHDFDSGAGVDVFQNVTIPVGASVTYSFQWDQPFFSVSGAPGSGNDVDICLTDDPPTMAVACSASANVGGDPVEVLSFTNTGALGTSFNIVIEWYTPAGGSAPGLIKYVCAGGNCSSVTVNEYHTSSSTLVGHANAAGAIAVGAADYRETPEFGVTPPLIESFSSAGPTPILFDTSGTALGMPEIRAKPEITAPQGGNTTFFGGDVEPDGFPNFFGTSASAPHAAGVAALMLDASSALTPDDILARMQMTAIDMDDPFTGGFDVGFDYASGSGLIQADLAIGGVPCSPPGAGDWTVASDCILLANDTAPANVIVNPGVTLTIGSGVTLDMNLGSFHLNIGAGAKVIIQAGGAIS